MSFDIDKEELTDAVQRGDAEWIWSAYRDAVESRDQVLAMQKALAEAAQKLANTTDELMRHAGELPDKHYKVDGSRLWEAKGQARKVHEVLLDAWPELLRVRRGSR